MKSPILKLAGVAAALLGSATLVASAPAAGDAASYVFREPPVNALGVKGIADLRGKPVLIDFWGTR